MKRYFVFAMSMILMAGVATTAWSQAGQSGPGGGGGASGGGGAGASGASGSPGGQQGGAGASGQQGAPAAVGQQGVGVGAGTNPQGRNVGANPQGRNLGANPNFNTTIPQTPFFTDPSVRRQLNLNDNQFNNLNRSYRNAYGRFNRNLTGLTNNLTLQQRRAQMEAFTNQFNNEFNQTLDSTFTDPQLRTRFDQLNRQVMGFSAFNNPGLQQQLNLTPQQLVQIRQLASVWRQQLREMRRQDGNASINNIDPQQWATLYNQYWDQLNATLTPEQQQLWMQLSGQRFNFPANIFSGDESLNVQGQYSDGTTPVNPSGQIYGDNLQLKGSGTPVRGGQNQPASNPRAPQGGTVR